MLLTQPIENPDRLPSSDQLICDDGEPMESARHRQQMTILIESLEYAWRERTDFYVGGNMFLYFSEAQVRNNDFRGPDVFVVLNTTRRERKAWVLWEEDWRAPDVIIELLSDSTEHVDRVQKKRIYAEQLEVGEYVLFDPFSAALEGYQLHKERGAYVRKKPNKQGRVHCAQLGLSLGTVRSTLYGVEADWLRWISADGTVLPMPSEDAVAAEARAGAAEERAGAAEERAGAEAVQARVEILLRLLTRKFGPVPDPARDRVARASIAALDRWTDRVLCADTLQDVFGNE